MEIIYDKKEYKRYFEEFKRKNPGLPPIIGYVIEKYDTLKIYFEQGDTMLYNVNTGETTYISTEREVTPKRKVGRPKKLVDRRDDVVKARVTELEKDKLKSLSDYYNKPSSDVLRDLINDKFSEVYKK